VEGAKTEFKYLEQILQFLLNLTNQNYEIYVHGTVIYDLYRKYVEGHYDYLIDYLVAEGNLKIPENTVPSQAFAAIYLIFDFDPHTSKYSDEAIQDCMNTFNDETSIGKLYINYPMFEAIKHFQSFPDPNYLRLDIEITQEALVKYKETVGSLTCVQDPRRYDRITLLKIIQYTYEKYNFICYQNERNEEPIFPLNCILLLNKQLERKHLSNRIYVINTCVLFIVDYNPRILEDCSIYKTY
jgi:hypothetical protein